MISVLAVAPVIEAVYTMLLPILSLFAKKFAWRKLLAKMRMAPSTQTKINALTVENARMYACLA